MSRKLIGTIDNDYFSPDNLTRHPERFVIIGFIAADGCIHQYKTGQPVLIFNLSTKDKIAIDKINEEICNSTRNPYLLKNTKSYAFTIPSTKISTDLARYNIVPRKTASFRLPVLPIKLMSYFLRGYFYGDGCIYGKGGRRRYTMMGTTNFVTSLKSYLIKHNIVERCSIYVKKKNPNYANIEIGGSQAYYFSNFLFDDDKMILLPRKHCRTDRLLHASHWTKREIDLLLSHKNDLDTFCRISGRSIHTARWKKRQLTAAGSKLA